jgi:hypothetical protein
LPVSTVTFFGLLRPFLSFSVAARAACAGLRQTSDRESHILTESVPLWQSVYRTFVLQKSKIIKQTPILGVYDIDVLRKIHSDGGS